MRQDDVQIGESTARSRQRLRPHNRIWRARRICRGDGRRVPNATRRRNHPKFSAAAHRCGGRVRWRRDTAPAPPPSDRARFRPATDASSNDRRKIRRADTRRARATERRARSRVRRFRSRRGQTRAPHARSSGSAPPNARSSAVTPRAVRLPKVPSHGRTGTSNRRRNAARCCPSARRSGAFARDGRIRRSSRSGWPQSKSPARRTATPPDACGRRRLPPRSVRSNPDRKLRCGWPRVRRRPQPIPLPPLGPRAPPRHCLRASAPGPCRRAPGRNRARRRWRCHRPAARPGRRSAPARWRRHRRLAPRPTTWTTRGRNDLPTLETLLATHLGILTRPSGCRKLSGSGFPKLVSRRSVLR